MVNLKMLLPSQIPIAKNPTFLNFTMKQPATNEIRNEKPKYNIYKTNLTFGFITPTIPIDKKIIDKVKNPIKNNVKFINGRPKRSSIIPNANNMAPNI